MQGAIHDQIESATKSVKDSEAALDALKKQSEKDFNALKMKSKAIVSKEVLLGMTKGKDANGQNVFHRAATYHNIQLLVNIVLNMESHEEMKEELNEQINAESKYGETPLLIASMHKNPINE